MSMEHTTSQRSCGEVCGCAAECKASEVWRAIRVVIAFSDDLPAEQTPPRRGVAFFRLPFFGEAKKVTRRQAKPAPDRRRRHQK
jgi:hypothetical protein